MAINECLIQSALDVGMLETHAILMKTKEFISYLMGYLFTATQYLKKLISMFNT